MIITFPKVYHCGFSHGFNINEAVNIATSDWIPFNREAMDICIKKNFYKKMVFPHEWIIYENM